MPTRSPVASSLAVLTLALVSLGCQPSVSGGPPPGTPGAAAAAEEDEADGPDTTGVLEDAAPFTQSSSPPTLGVVRVPPVLNPATPIVTRPAALLPGGFIAADVAAPTTGQVLDGGRLGHDPQVAVSDKVLIVYTAHRYQMLDKATGLPLAAEGEIAPVSDFNTLFSPLWSHRDHGGAVNVQNINTRLAFIAGDVLTCDPAAPTQSHACVQEFYDSRIMWDASRRRFWVESAARNHLWFCDRGAACDGPKQTRTQARRYIAIAVSKTEDPRQGFHRYILVNQYTDWPKIAIHERYLILGHRSSSVVHVFDADKLAAGNEGGGPVKLARLDQRTLKGMKLLTPVTHHGPTNGMTYLLGSDGSDTIRVFGLYHPGGAARPIMVTGPRVDIGEKLGSLDGNAVYRNGFLYWTRDEWAPGHKDEYRQVRVTRLPVRLGAGRRAPRIWASSDPRYGFRDTVIGEREPDDPTSAVMDYEKPALDVNGNEDVVVVYSRKSFRSPVEVPPEVRYSIVYRGEQRARPGVLVRRGTTSAVPDINDNGKAGIDLAFAQVDPADDRTVWITHAYADAQTRWYRQIVAATRP